jgi:hypothetical protein
MADAHDVARLDTRSVLLAAAGRSPDIPESEDAYGWLVGSWELEVLTFWATDVSAQGMTAEAHFGWALEGRAIQDVWIMPRVHDRTGRLDDKFNMYGTTLRVWDPSIEAWQITWTNPAGGHHERQMGHRVGKDVVQIGTRPNGATTRWMFSEINSDSFRWTGEVLNSDGRTWTLEGEFRARRMR